MPLEVLEAFVLSKMFEIVLMLSLFGLSLIIVRNLLEEILWLYQPLLMKNLI